MNKLSQQDWTNKNNKNMQKFSKIFKGALLGAVVSSGQFATPILAQTSSSSNVKSSSATENYQQQSSKLAPAIVPEQAIFPKNPFDSNIPKITKLSLKQAIEIALAHNPSLSSYQWQIEENKALEQEANSGLLPTVTLKVLSTYSDSAAVNAINAQLPSLSQNGKVTSSQVNSSLTNNNTFSQAQSDVLTPYIVNSTNALPDAFNTTLGNSLTLTGNIQINWYIFTSGKVQNSILAAAKNTEASYYQYQNAKLQLIYQVITAYTNVQLAYGTMQIELAAVASAKQLLYENQEKHKVGYATTLDVLQAETNLSNANLKLTSAKNDLLIKQELLSELLSLQSPEPLEPSDSIAEMGAWDLSVDQTILRAFELRPELKQNKALEQSAKAAEAEAYGSVAPQVSIFANLQSLTGNTIPGTFGGYNAGMQLQWEAYDGGMANAQAQTQITKAYQARLSFASSLNQIRFDVQSSMLNLNTAKQQIETTQTAIVSATEAQRKVLLFFSRGYATTTDVILNQQNLTEAKVNHLTAIINYNQALAKIHRSVGILDQ